MKTPIVEIDGDEMTRVIWAWVKDILLKPHVDLLTEYYDLGLANRDLTDDAVTDEAAEAARRLGVAVKCATITPNEERMIEYGLQRLYPSPNATIRAALDGTVFRTPILVAGINPYVSGWRKPITIARHAYGDIYKASELSLTDGWQDAKVELVATRPNGEQQSRLIHDFGSSNSQPAGGIVQGIHNTEASIHSFARSCFEYALSRNEDLWFSCKDTVSKTYDRRFRDIFDNLFAKCYQDRFTAAGIEFYYTLIDDAVARVMRSEGGFIWATKNYDGDVMSDMVASAFGSLAMMSSVLVSPDGIYEYEAAHGTVQRHYYRWQNGEKTSTNPVAIIFAWTGALARRGQLDGLPELTDFAKRLETATLDTIARGTMTADLAAISSLTDKKSLDTEAFLNAVAIRLQQ
ncbi:MAG: NADP-dependent isocitrate dehydrogenase [Coriobacteriales bacterium]|nr:NADP-dependent isocitrate dehydrogenase [Coriobacteriales bacterium]